MKNKINGFALYSMLQAGSENLQKNVDRINTLNVFPVPDGDTGTNMNLTFAAGISEAKRHQSELVSDISQALSKGLLMGARGNSGVILSQLFRGFAAYTKEKGELTVPEFAEALQNGVDFAYKAVIKPIEGTILTVARETAEAAVRISFEEEDFIVFMEKVVVASKESLRKTPDLLPVLKEVGVVDSGGQGLVCVYEGFLASLKGESLPDALEDYSIDNKEQHVQDEVALLMKEGILSEEDITFGYCTEFMIRLKGSSFDEHLFREKLSRFGDSLLVISDEELVKIHIHAEELSQVFALAQTYGELLNIKIENMREQFRTRASQTEPIKDLAFVAILMGEGMSKIYQDLGVEQIIEGGQTMNPSTEDLVKAIEKANAKHVFVLPNNSNIILAAQQAAELTNVSVSVIPTKNVIQGIQSLLYIDRNGSIQSIEEQMLSSLASVECGQLTKAVRNTTIDEVEVREGEFIGIANGKLAVCCDNLEESLLELLKAIVKDEHELISLYYGEDITEEFAQILASSVEEVFEELEVQVIYGGQPLYPLYVGVE